MRNPGPNAVLLLIVSTFLFGMASCATDSAAPAAATHDVPGDVPGDGGKKPSGAPDTEKIKITRLDDLPRHTYAASGSLTDLVRSRALTAELSAKVKADIESDLSTYEIADRTTLKNMYGTLVLIDYLAGDFGRVTDLIDKMRALEDKDAARLTAGLVRLSIIAAREEVGESASAEELSAAYRKHLAARAGALPWRTVEDTIEELKGRAEIMSENLLIGIIQAQIEPVVAKTGVLNADQARTLIGAHLMIKESFALNKDLVAVFQKLIDANKVVKADIWAERAVHLTPGKGYGDVLAAVWDSGTDSAIFSSRLFVNEKEKLDGADSDGNGFVDDVHGIAYDYHARRSSGCLFPLGDAADRMPVVMEHIKGLSDIQASVDSKEASAFKKHLAGLNPADVKGFLEDVGLASNYAHGTHVAGIMAEGNPYIKLLVARHSYDYHMVPVARTVEWAERDAAKCRDTVAYLMSHGVRVVNMSWGEAQADAEASLEANGIGKDGDERRKMARAVFEIQKNGLREAIENAPEILFVCAAGNSDNDVEFDDFIPSSFDLPNLLVVGAVDQAGDPTSFTSFGKTVQLYANGFEVESYVPGGERMEMSGTSMASPNVANLSAKLLAVKPDLTPAALIALLKESADKKQVGSRTILLMNPKGAMERLSAQ